MLGVSCSWKYSFYLKTEEKNRSRGNINGALFANLYKYVLAASLLWDTYSKTIQTIALRARYNLKETSQIHRTWGTQIE